MYASETYPLPLELDEAHVEKGAVWIVTYVAATTVYKPNLEHARAKQVQIVRLARIAMPGWQFMQPVDGGKLCLVRHPEDAVKADVRSECGWGIEFVLDKRLLQSLSSRSSGIVSDCSDSEIGSSSETVRAILGERRLLPK